MNVYLPNGRLPSAYQEVEYIQSSGTQYIDTGFIPNQNTKVELSMGGWSNVGTYCDLFGVRYEWSDTGRGFHLGRNSNDTNVYAMFGKKYSGSSWYSSFSFNNGSNHILEMSQSGIYEDGTLRASLSSSTFTSPTNLTIFALNDNGTINSQSSYKLYYFKIRDNGNLVRDFIPCYRKSDSVIGLYDLVNNQFYTNSGTGTFSKGNDVTMAELKNAYIGEVWTPGSNTIVYYEFNGNLNDSSGNGHNLTNSGAVSYNSTPSSINLSLSSYLYTNPNDTFNHDWTLNAWIYFNTFGQTDNAELLTIGGKGTRKLIACGISKQGVIRLDFYSDDHAGNIALQLGQWYNVVWTYNYSTKAYNAYVNGVNGLTGTLGTQYSIDSGKTLNIGVFPSDISTTAGRIDGKLSEYIVESKAWALSEIQHYFDITKANYGL